MPHNYRWNANSLIERGLGYSFGLEGLSAQREVVLVPSREGKKMKRQMVMESFTEKQSLGSGMGSKRNLHFLLYPLCVI